MKNSLLKLKEKLKLDEPRGNYALLIVLCLFVILQFFLQTSFAVMEKELAHDFNIDGGYIGLLSSAFFYSYIALQMPVGLLLDRYGVKKICTLSLSIMGFACLLFGSTSDLRLAFLSRAIMGLGAAAGFVAMLKCIHLYFENRKFIFLLSMSEFLGMLGLTVCTLIFSYITDHINWRTSLYVCAAASFALAFAINAIYTRTKNFPLVPVQQDEAETASPSAKEIYKNVFFNKAVWANGLYAFFFYSIITVFCALWGVPYTEKVYSISTTKATSIINFIYLGLGFASLFLSWFVDKVGLAKITRLSPLLSLILLIIYIYFPPSSLLLSSTMMFVIGLGCASYQLAFGIVSQSVPSRFQSSANGMTNMILMSSALLLQPLVGLILTYSKGQVFDQKEVYTIMQYRGALILLPLSLFLSFLFSFFILPKKTPEHLSPEKYNH